MTDRAKKILFGFVLAVLTLPLAQQCFNIFGSGQLYGVFQIADDITFNPEKWINGTYQEQKEKYLNDHAPFRPDLVRLNCQIDYSLFHKTNTGWSIIGKKECLIDQVYIDAWNGADFLGDDTIRVKMMKLKALQDTFAKLGKSVLLVHAASKGFFYADCIPDGHIPPQKRPTNYERYLHIGDSLGVNQLDLNSLFNAMKDTSKSLLYPKQSIHWSYYGGMVAGEELIRRIEKMRNIHMPHPHWENIIRTTEPRYPDNDIGRIMNLMWPMTTETFTYGTTVCDKDSSQTRPKTIYIGDSFLWAVVDDGIFDCVNSSWEIWFYMKELHTRAYEPREPKPMETYDWVTAIDKTDCIVLWYTAPNLTKLGSGFIEMAYDHYFPGKKTAAVK